MLQSSLDQYRKVVADTMAYEGQLASAQQILNEATGEVLAGASTHREAVRRAVKRMADDGLTGFVDRGGHHWSPEAYVSMDIRTTVTNTAHQATWARCDEYGLDLIVVSTKAAARPLCYPWQGKVLSRANRARDVTDIDGNTIHVYAMSETSYGEPAGIFGINCGHFSSPFFPGLSKVRGQPEPESVNERKYAESQKQRYLERRIRRAKLDVAIAKATQDDEAVKDANRTLRARQAAMREFIRDTGRTRRRDREYTPTRWKEEWAQ